MNAPRRLLLTGFGPFEGVERNPTECLVKLLAQEAIPGVRIEVRVLPTSFERAPAEIGKLLASNPFDLVVHLGVSGRATGLVLERKAWNLASCSKPDIDGSTLQKRPLDSSLPLDSPLETSLDLKRLLTSLTPRIAPIGLEATISEDPGRYVCNATYFSSLRVRRDALFVHVPLARESVNDDSAASRPTLADLQSSLRVLIEQLLEQTRRSNQEERLT